MNKSEFGKKYTPDYIENIIVHLRAPDLVDSAEDAIKKASTGSALWSLSSKIFTGINRAKNSLINDGIWYNEAKARELLLDYTEKPECAQALYLQHDKILQIFERLTQISNGQGCWADGIDRELLEKNDSDRRLGSSNLLASPSQHSEANNFFVNPDELFLPKPPQLSVEAKELPAGSVGPADPRGDAHIFVRRKNLSPPTSRQIFQIHGSQFGGIDASELAGGQSQACVTYLHSFLKQEENNSSAAAPPPPAGLVDQLACAVSIAYDPKDYNGSTHWKAEKTQDYVGRAKKNITEAFTTMKPLLLMGGWIGTPSGHAIYYEIIPNRYESNKACFRLYNSGAGISEHIHVRDGNKIKYQSYCEWKGIARDRLESSEFLEALYELNSYDTLPLSNTKSSYGERDIYEAVKSLLAPSSAGKAESPSKDSHLLMSPQRSGVCSWRSLMAVVRTKMALNDYKRFNCDIQLQSLIDYVEAYKGGAAPTSRDWRLVEKSHKDLCCSIDRLSEKKIVGTAYLESVQQPLAAISAWIAQHESCLYRRGIEELAPTYSRCCEESAIENRHHLSSPLAALTSAPQAGDAVLQPCQYVLESFKQINSTSPTLVAEAFSQVNMLARKAWTEREDMALHKGIISFVSNLALDEMFWKKTVAGAPQTAKKLLVQLGTLAQLFAKSCFTVPAAHIIFPEKIYVFNKILYLQELLCRFGHPNTPWEKIALHNIFQHRREKEDLFLRFPQAAMHREMLAIYGRKSPENPIEMQSNRSPERSTEFVGLCLPFSAETGASKVTTFEELIRQQLPEVITAIAKEVHNFQALPKFSQDAHIYASAMLPAWVKAMRDTQLYCCHMKYACVGPLAGIDREKDIVQQFFVEDNKELSTVTVTLQGVNSDIFSTKEVKKIRDTPHLRYAGQYREIAAQPIRQLLAFLHTHTGGKFDNRFTEKELSITTASENKIDMPDEEFKELAHLFLNSDMQHIETLEFFTKEKLKDPDYQTLLQLLLFQLGLLDKNLSIEGFSRHLALFLQRNYELFREEDEIPTCVYLLKLAHQLQSFCPKVDLFRGISEKLLALLHHPAVEADVKGLIYAEILAQLSHEHHLNDEEIATLVAGTIYIQENQSNSKYKEDPYTAKEVREALVLHQRQIQEVLERGKPNQQLLNSILHTLRPEVQGEKEWHFKAKRGEFPSFFTSDNEHCLQVLQAKLLSAEVPTLLPRQIRENSLFAELFPGIEKASYCPGNVFSFIDAQGRKTLVCMKADTIVIEQQLESGASGWFRYVPASSFLFEDGEKRVKSVVGSRQLVNAYSHWQALQGDEGDAVKIYAMDPKSGKRCYCFTGRSVTAEAVRRELQEQIAKLKRQHIEKYNEFYKSLFEDEIKSIKKPEQVNEGGFYFKVNKVRRLVDDAELGAPSPLLTPFEEPAYIHEWYDEEGLLKHVELPRFALSFKPMAKKGGKLVCEQFPDYTLNSSVPVPELGVHRNFLLLEDSKGHRKVLMPRQQLKAADEKEVLIPRYEVDRQLARGSRSPQAYFTFDISAEGKLVSRARLANLYLAHVLTAAQQYPQAVYYLKKFGEKLTAYTAAEAEALCGICRTSQITGDISGNGVALQLYADFLLIKNSSSHHHEVEKSDKEALRRHYDLYISHYRHATELKLQREQELYILKKLLIDTFDAGHYLRLKELDPLAAAAVQLPKPLQGAAAAAEDKPIGLEGFTVPNHMKGDFRDRKPYNHVLLTRAYADMERNFIYFYEMARKGSSDERRRLLASLPFVRTAESGKHAGLADFFEALLANPTAFPEPLVEKDYLVSNEKNSAIAVWQRLVRDTAIEILARKQRKYGSDRSQVDQTDMPQGVSQLDGAAAPAKDVALNYTLPKLTPFSDRCKAMNCFMNISGKQGDGKADALAELLHSCGSDDPVHSREIDRLLTDLQVYQQQPNDNDIAKAVRILSENKEEDVQQLASLEKKILALANKESLSAAFTLQNRIKKWGGLRKILTVEELTLYFGRQDILSLMQRNPALNASDTNTLMELTGTFLLYATRCQQRCRAEGILQKIEALKAERKDQPQEYNDLVAQLAQNMLTEPTYSPAERPAYLVFEYFADIALRAAQVEKLEKFLQHGDANLVMEMIMGSGKSKVLLPLLGLLRADGTAISMLIVSQPLFESVSQDTQTILQNAFGQPLRSLHFERQTQFTKESLEGILDDLTNIQKNRECLIMTGKSVQCLLLKFIEKCADHFLGAGRGKEFPAEIKLMQKILTTLRRHGYPVIDEADTVLNVLHEVCFSCGKTLAPKAHELELLSEIYSLCYEEGSLRKIARIESDVNGIEDAQALTEPLYYKEMQRPLAEALIGRLGKKVFSNAALTEKIQLFFQKLSKKDLDLLMHYLCRDKAHIHAAQQYFDSLDSDVQDIIALAGEEISHLLPYTLTRICDEKYGLDENSSEILAISFSAANTPNSGSQFSNPHITMNYTFQTYMKKGISRKMVEKQIELLQENAVRDSCASAGKLLPIETEAGKAFCKLKGAVSMPFFNYKPWHLDALVTQLNASASAKRAFVSQIILPQMEHFESKLSCNPQNLAALFFKASGFTGTLWNWLSMYHKLTPTPEVGTDAKTLLLLWNNSRTDTIVIKEGSTRQMLKQFKDNAIVYDMISDAGGYFKQGSNREVAREMAAISGKPVVFYSSGEQTILEGEGSTELPLAQSATPAEERKTFLDQSHTTGADVLQKRDAVSLVTVGRNLTLRDLLQSAWRLRGLDKSQRVRFVVTEEVAGIIRQSLNLNEEQAIQFDEILKFAVANQTAQQGRDNYKGLRQELANLPQQILLQVLLQQDLVAAAQLQAFSLLQACWIKPASATSRERYGILATDMRGDLVLNLDKNKCIDDIKDIFLKMPWLEKMGISQKEYLKEVEVIVARIKDSLPAFLQVPSKECEDDQTAEVERETHKEISVETEKEVETHEILPAEDKSIAWVVAEDIQEFPSFAEAVKAVGQSHSVSYSNKMSTLNLNKCPVFPLKSYLDSNKDEQWLWIYSKAFNDISISVNILEWTINRKGCRVSDHFSLLGSSRIPFHHLLVRGGKVILLSQEDAAHHRGSPDYYNLTLGFNDPDKKLPTAALLKVVKLKFLSGEAHYSEEELQLLRKWFAVQGASKMRKLYLERIIAADSKKQGRFVGSALQQLFAAMCR